MYSGKNQEQLMRNRMATRKEQARKRSICYKLRLTAIAILAMIVSLTTGVSNSDASVKEDIKIIKEEISVENTNIIKTDVDKFVNKWINTHDYNDTALTYGHNFTGSNEAIVQTLKGNWTRESIIGTDYTLIIETTTVKCEEIYTVYVIPTNDFEELNMESFNEPFLCYYESVNYSYVKSSLCKDLEDSHTEKYNRISHIVR